ncbi:MAG: type 4a pilus biogenesis protein PilO [Proteobacteria bacterium]|nr:type 4a pilus biogenesis protein PilO [Pseudomonadota bacterium]
MNEKFKLGIIVLALGVFYGSYELYDFFSVDQVKMQAEISSNNQTLNDNRNQLTKLRSFSAGINEIKQRLKKTNTEFEEALLIIPRTLDLSQLLARLNVLAKNSGIEIETFKPLKEEPVGADAAKVKSFYREVLLEMQLHGSFSQTLVFFDQVSRTKRIMNVESVKMVPAQENGITLGSANQTNPIVSTVLFKTYRFSE